MNDRLTTVINKNPMVSRAKFTCTQVTKRASHWLPEQKYLYDFEFMPVTAYNSKDTSENRKFWQSTPVGKLTMACVNPDLFEIGKEYYLDFSLAEAAE